MDGAGLGEAMPHVNGLPRCHAIAGRRPRAHKKATALAVAFRQADGA
jgi:hypothetical protein